MLAEDFPQTLAIPWPDRHGSMRKHASNACGRFPPDFGNTMARQTWKYASMQAMLVEDFPQTLAIPWPDRHGSMQACKQCLWKISPRLWQYHGQTDMEVCKHASNACGRFPPDF